MTWLSPETREAEAEAMGCKARMCRLNKAPSRASSSSREAGRRDGSAGMGHRRDVLALLPGNGCGA